MLNANFLKFFGIIMIFLSYLHATMFDWNTKLKNLETVRKNKPRRTLIFKCILGHHIFYSIFNGIKLVTDFRSATTKDFLGLTVTFIWFLAYAWAAVIMVNLLTKRQDMVWLFNQLVIFDSNYQREYRQIGKSRLLEIILWVVAYGYVVATIVWGIIIWQLQSRVFLYSAVPDYFRNPILYGIFVCFEIFSKTEAISHLFWDLLFLEINVLVPSHWMKISMADQKTKQMQIEEYRLLQVLNNYINASHLSYKYPFVVGIMLSFLVMGYCGIIRLFGKLSLETYALYPAIINNCTIIPSLILLPSAKWYKLSAEYCEKIKCKVPLVVGKVPRRQIKSLKAFGIKFWILKTIKYLYFPAFILSVSNYTLSLLVAFPHTD